jgi:hypothetical protein
VNCGLERVDHSQAADPLPVLQVFGVDRVAARCDCRLDHHGVPDRKAISLLHFERAPDVFGICRKNVLFVDVPQEFGRLLHRQEIAPEYRRPKLEHDLRTHDERPLLDQRIQQRPSLRTA